MTTIATAEGPTADLRPPGDRGTTTVADRVVAAVVARAATEVPGVGGAARKVLGVAVDSTDPARAPHVDVTVAGETVAVRIRLSVAYPTPVRAAADQVRLRVAAQVEALVGKKVGVVDVTVAALPVPAAPTRVVR